MYFWNIDALKADLRATPLPALDVLSYALATLALVAFAWLAPQPDGAVSPPPMKWFALLLFIVNAVGLWAANRANGGAAGTGDLLGVVLTLGLLPQVLLYRRLAYHLSTLHERPST